MRFGCITLFPEMFETLTRSGVVGTAILNGIIECKTWQLRDFSHDVHRRVDDRPYGGGPGMVLQAGPLVEAIQHAKSTWEKARVVYLAPDGQPFTQKMAVACAKSQTDLIFVSGRYEGIDERAKVYVDETWSLGDYVLTGGELAAMVMIDAIARLLPGVLGHEGSPLEESFSAGRLEYPQYTRPHTFEGVPVPEVLLSGDHRAIATWRHQQSLIKTWQLRPDLIATYPLSDEDKAWLETFLNQLRSDENDQLNSKH